MRGFASGSLRPIAIGETIRWLTSKVAVDLITERAREIFEPLQLGLRHPMAVKPSYTLLGSGSPVTAQTQARSPPRWTCPTLSTRFTEQPSFGPCASTFRPSLHGSTAVIAARAPCSPAPEAWPCRSSQHQGSAARGPPRSCPLRFGGSPSHRRGPCRHGDLAPGRHRYLIFCPRRRLLCWFRPSRPLLPYRSH